jgi:hypothetical protein
MINIPLTVREAMNLATNCDLVIYEKIVNAFEIALGVYQKCDVTITGGMSTDNRIPCIKAIRLHTGWSLKEAKDWTDVVIGSYGSYNQWVPGKGKNTMTLKTPEAAENLLRDLAGLGCEGFLC